MERSAEISHDLWFAANKNFFRDKFGRLEEWNFFREIEGISTTLKSWRIYVVFLCDSVKESLPLLGGLENLLLGLIEDKRVLGGERMMLSTFSRHSDQQSCMIIDE